MRRVWTVCRVVAAVALATALLDTVARAQEVEAGPTITLSKTSVNPNETTLVTIDGFDANGVVLSVCGNAARRRSEDCNLVGSENQHLNRDGTPTIAALPVAPPVLPCPCVVMASTRGFEQLAIAPIEILGHPVGPIVGPKDLEPIDVTINAEKAPHGLIATVRSLLGGPTAYDVTVTVENHSTETISNISIAGAAGRFGDDDATAIEFPAVGELSAGAGWTDERRVTVPAPVVGSVTFEATASGAGPSVTASQSSTYLPPLLVLFVLIFIVDLAAIVWRRVSQRRQREEAEVPVPAERVPSLV